MPGATTKPGQKLSLPLLLLGTLGVAAAWVLVAVALGRQSSWMALLAAADAVVLLQLGGMRAGWRRGAWAVVATVAAAVLANWGIIATQVGMMIGMGPLDSATRLGAPLAWTLAKLANGPADVAWVGAGMLVAAVLGRGFSVPRPAP